MEKETQEFLRKPMAKETFKPVFQDILDVYPGPGTQNNPQYKAFYEEIVTRCVADVAGMLQSAGSDAKNPRTSRFIGSKAGQEQLYGSEPGAELGAMSRMLASKYGEEKARDLIIGNLPGFTKGLVYTPHPTEMLSDAGIEAQDKLMAVLIKTPKLFKAGQSKYLTSQERSQLHSALKELSETIQTPLSEQLSIEQEMRRSIRFSQRQFDSIPGIADTILAATRTPSSAQLSMKQLEKFGYLIEPETWSPGDQDSKPDMTADKLEKGSNLSRRAMMFHYYRTLAALGANVKGEPSPEKDEALHAIQVMMHRLLKAGCESYDNPIEPTPKIARDKLTGVSEARTNGVSSFSARFASYADSSFFKQFERDFAETDKEAKPYASADEFLRDLGNLRQRGVVQGIKDDKRKSITVIDSLIIQTMNFRDSALRIQVRQNAEMHSHVLDTLLNMLPADKIPPGVSRQHLHDEESSASVEKLLEAFKSDPEFRKLVQDKVRASLEPVREEYRKLKSQGLDDKAYQQARQQLVARIGDKNDEAYQVLETLGLAARQPDRIPRYLIAECRSKTDMLEAFFLLKVMESMEAPKVKDKVEIVNLVEHPDLVMQQGPDKTIVAARMTSGAFDNDQFREHHLSITSSNHLLQSYSLKEGDHPMTVAEAKRTYGIKPADGDETRKVVGVKMMMGAGSDITKAGSSAAAAAMMEATERTREALLNNKDHPVLLVDYIGCGGGVHRTQPVSTSYETVQGQSMRQSPENIAQKVLGLLTDFMHRRLAMNPEVESTRQGEKWLSKLLHKDDQNLMSRVNMSNLAGLSKNDAMWEARTKDRTYAMMRKYGKLYASDEFRELMSYSADMYANLTKFAARPTARVGAVKKPQGYLAPVNVKETRAIGFGAALNAAGICAPLYYGGSEYLKSESKESDSDVRAMYLYEPKAQDTINRMTYGVIMADMDVAWKYLGREHPPTVTELQKIAAGTPEFANKEKPTQAERHAMAEKALAEINLEYNQVAGKLLRLHQSMTGRPLSEVTDGKQAATELLAILPTALREQLSLSREHISAPRHALADLFMKMGKGDPDPRSVTKESPEYKAIIYPAMGALFECFEHTPRAYTRPKWVRATEPHQERAA